MVNGPTSKFQASSQPPAGPSERDAAAAALYQAHGRTFENNRFVYPVLSRRSGGISIGVNLNPDKVCNFDCIYCQVDRVEPSQSRFVAMDQLLEELAGMLDLATSGALYQHPRFQGTPTELRRLKDIAFSGDGEPTTFRNFDTIIQRCAELKRWAGLDDVKLVLITNASMFHRPRVRRGLAILDQNNGEIWAKLDAGTPEYFQLVDRTSIPFQQVIENISQAARARPIVIQSLLMRVQGQPPSQAELQALCDRLREIVTSGGQIKLVQVYTIARTPAESFVTPLTKSEVDAIVDLVRQRTGLEVQGYYGPTAE
jgi:wyosine [tRNA(Phe)-imidazoG37] synthetase (radical SAM superfamily)